MVDTAFIRKHVIQETTNMESAASRKWRFLAVASLVLWAGAVFSGRFLAYTFRYMDSSFNLHRF
jgi:hypothetical protein